MFLPANTTSHIQPMDQGILESVKRRYKKLLLRHLILEEKTSHLAIPAVLKELTIKHAVYWAAQAWSETSTDCLSRGWNNLLKPDDHMMVTRDIESDTESAEISGLFQELGVSETEDWLNDDYLDPGFEIITDEEIVSPCSKREN